QSPNRFPQGCAGDVELAGEAGFQDYIVRAEFPRTKHVDYSCVRHVGERPAIRMLGGPVRRCFRFREGARNRKLLLGPANCTSVFVPQYTPLLTMA
ncbi:MAG TPA: hypothetical protein VIH54_13640, partial [Chthoniobacterales bacterium]